MLASHACLVALIIGLLKLVHWDRTLCRHSACTWLSCVHSREGERIRCRSGVTLRGSRLAVLGRSQSVQKIYVIPQELLLQLRDLFWLRLWMVDIAMMVMVVGVGVSVSAVIMIWQLARARGSRRQVRRMQARKVR